MAARVAHGTEEVDPGPSAVTIGFFDGVHRGHQEIIGRAVRAAQERGIRSVVVTFDRHPSEVLRPGSQPRYLQTLDDRVASLLAQGVDLVLVLPFTEEFSHLDPDAFVEQVLVGPLAAVRVVIGENFRFGHKAAGDADVLEELGSRHGFDVEAVSLTAFEDRPVSSTEIRAALDAGDVAAAAAGLGRPFRLSGIVVRGDGRGRSIGVPTANVAVDQRLQIPATGVYAGSAMVAGEQDPTPCVVNVGTRPTFGGRHVTVEAYLLDTDRDLYGEQLQVAFEARLRDERRFDGVEALVAQIRRDIEATRKRAST